MGTRATYRIKEYGDQRIEQCIQYFYIHWDGYPEGALEYIKKGIEAYESNVKKEPELRRQHRRGQFINAFGYANFLAEYTEGNEEHSDTEYQYNVYFNSLTTKIEIEMKGINEQFDGNFEAFKKKYEKQGQKQ